MWQCHSLVCPVEGQGMASEVNDILTQVKLLINISHGHLRWVNTLHCFGIIFIEIGNKHQELPEPPLLKEPHQT